MAIIMFNSTLKYIGNEALDNCDELLLVYIPYKCAVDVKSYVYYDVAVLRIPDLQILVYDRPLSSFQSVQHVVLPQGLEIIGDSWFAGDKI